MGKGAKRLLGVCCIVVGCGMRLVTRATPTVAFGVTNDEDPCPAGCEDTLDAALRTTNAYGACTSPAPTQQCIESVYGTMDAGACTAGWTYSAGRCATSASLLGCCVLFSDAGAPAVATCYYQLPNQSRSAEPQYRSICTMLQGSWQVTVP
jgi:hypothetical protein